MQILLSRTAKKQLLLCPKYIARKFDYWVDMLDTVGLREARKHRGFQDEPLQGDRQGQRSARLSKSYRVIYREVGERAFEIIEVLEVNKHEY